MERDRIYTYILFIWRTLTDTPSKRRNSRREKNARGNFLIGRTASIDGLFVIFQFLIRNSCFFAGQSPIWPQTLLIKCTQSGACHSTGTRRPYSFCHLSGRSDSFNFLSQCQTEASLQPFPAHSGCGSGLKPSGSNESKEVSGTVIHQQTHARGKNSGFCHFPA